MKTVSQLLTLTLIIIFFLVPSGARAQCNANQVNFVDFSNTICNMSAVNMQFTTTTNDLNQVLVSVYDYTLPTGLQGKLEIKAKGGNGGNSSINCSGMIYGNGGKGAFMWGTVTIGTDAGMVPPGSTIRYVIGEAGENSVNTATGDDYVRGGGGGGSTAVLFKAPDSTSWQVLMVAAGGGGGTCECRIGTEEINGVPVPFLYVDHKNGTDGTLPYRIVYRDSIFHNSVVMTQCQSVWGYLEPCPLKSVVPVFVDYWYGPGGVIGYANAIGGGGGGVEGRGEQLLNICNTECAGGQSGGHWLSDNANHVIYAAFGDDCIGPRATFGGRGFTGGGAGLSRSNVAGAGGGGGIKGGNTGGGYGTSLYSAEGGYSGVNRNYVTLLAAKADTTAYIDGYADFKYLPGSESQGQQARLDILPSIPAPFCDSTEVTFIARPVYPDGSPTDGFTNLVSNVPVYRWSVNGVQVAAGQTYADSTVILKYIPGDIIWCQLWAKDTNACGRIAIPIGTVTLPARTQPEPVSAVTIMAEPGDTVCQKRVYDEFGGYNLEAWATFRASTVFLPTPYAAGNGNYMYTDTTLTAQEIALRACEAEYGPGNCSIGTSQFYCQDRPLPNAVDRLYMGQIWVDNDRLRTKYYSNNGYLVWPTPVVVTSQLCNGYTYYYRTGTSQTVPGHGAHQFVFAAENGITGVNEDFSNGVIQDTGTFVQETSIYLGNNQYTHIYDTITFDQTDTVKYPAYYGESVSGKLPFMRTSYNNRWQLGEANLGTTVYTGNLNYQPTYNWYRNGFLQGTGHSYTDGNGVMHLDTIPFTADTLWVRNLSEGETVTCKVTGPHCGTPYNSNTLVMHVREPSIGGVISGPQNPCKNSQVSYHVSGAENALAYVWQIEGPVYNLTGTDTTRTFWVGEDTVKISCMPIGPCGQGDTARFTVVPGIIINGPCTAAPLTVNTNGVRCQGVPKPATITVQGNFGCYEWSNGASTPSVTVFDDGDYFVYLNGCKSEVVTITSTGAQHPAVSIAIDAPLPGQEGPWCKNNNTKTITATTGNYTGTPNVNYEWYRNGVLYSTQAGGLFLNLNVLNSYDTIQCKITLDEQCAVPVWSNKVVLPAISANAASSIGIGTSSPEGCAGDTVTFTALPYNGGDNPTYTWRIDGTFVSDTTAVYKRAWANSSGFPETHTIVCTLFGSELPCRIGTNIKQTSILYVINPKTIPSVTISSENTAVCPGSSITYNATAINGGSAPLYQWFKNNVAVGTNSAVYTNNNVATGDTVYCLLTNTDGTPCIAPPAASNKLGAKVYAPFSPVPIVWADNICLNSSTALSATMNPNVSDFTRQGFGGIYAPSQWTKTLGCMGEITTSMSPVSVDISVVHPPYGPSFTTCNNEMSITMTEDATVSFDWAYRLTSSTSNDVPYVLVDTMVYTFPEIAYNTTQVENKSGHFYISVLQGQTLTLRQKGVIYETMNQSQPIGAVTTFTNFTVATQPAIKWYDAPQGGNIIGFTLAGNVLTVTPSTPGVTHYYAAAANTDAGCGLRAAVAVTVKAPGASTHTVSACESYTWIDGTTYTASNNTATHTLTGSNGCDSVVTLNLTINNATTGTDIITACDSYTWIDGTTYTASNNTATHTLTGSNGCDSVVTLNLTINNATTGTDIITACESYTWIDGATYTASNNTATHTLTGSNGCDSVVTLNLTINNATAGTDIVTACESYTWIDGITYTASNNTATHTLTGSNGCDSVVTLNLTINNATTGTDIVTACESYTWIDGTTYTANNNTATYTLTGSNGCDSVVTLNLTINNATTGTDIVTACDSYTWIDGITYTASNNTATHTLTGSNGCDSVVTLNLTINNATTGTDIVTACESYTWIDGATYTVTNNTATYTLTGSNGCDSVVTLNLTINNATTGTDIVTACESYTWIDGVTYTASNTTTTHTLTASNGCDSVVTLNLTINNATTGTDIVTACESYTWIDGATYTASNNTATHTLTGGNGCDSVVTLNLTINNATTGIDIITACESYTWIDGVTYTASNNTSTHTLTGGNGCDSVVTLNLTIHALPDAVINRVNDTLSTQVFTSYHWLLNGNEVGSNSELIITANGNYSVVVTDAAGCSDTSAVLNIANLSIGEVKNISDVFVYPNPNEGRFKIVFSDALQHRVYVTDAMGQLIINEFSAGQYYNLDIANQSSGIYFLVVNNGRETETIKISVVK